MFYRSLKVYFDKGTVSFPLDDDDDVEQKQQQQQQRFFFLLSRVKTGKNIIFILLLYNKLTLKLLKFN